MDINCTKEELELLKKVATAAETLGMEAYLIGGFVRDKILGRETKDADFVCLGDAIDLAKEVAKKFRPQPHVDYFKNFGTAHFRLDNNLTLNLLAPGKKVTGTIPANRK